MLCDAEANLSATSKRRVWRASNWADKRVLKKVVSDFIKEFIARIYFLNGRCVATLMKSLRSYQDFLRRDSLSCP